MAPQTAQGHGASKKVAGLPVYIWIGAAAAGLLLGLWLRSRSSGTAAGAAVPVATTDTSGSGSLLSDPGSLTNALAGGGIAPASPGIDPDLVSQLLSGQNDAITALSSQGEGAALGAQQNALDLLSGAVGTLVNLASSGGSGSSSAGKTNTGIQTSTKPNLAVAPKPAPKAPTKKVASTPTKYFTYKADAAKALKAGQTVHFTTGRGYFNA